ncbi:MAG: hypothetical protein ABIG44_04490 [Planctomycetota bacterium]
MKATRVLTCMGLACLLWGCLNQAQTVNPFLTLTETFGIPSGTATDEGDGIGQGTAAAAEFRRDITVTFRNNHTGAELECSFVAWVGASSIRSAEQQDALFADGYVQLRRELRLGNAFTLPVGTFVYDGEGTAGATAIRLEPAQAGGGGDAGQGVVPTTESITMITPDVVLAFVQPPVSCESVAFVYTRDGEPLTAVPVGGAVGPYSGSTGQGGFKTLAQVDVYQCEPLRPGLFIKLGGGAREPNEYFEGENITFDFNQFPDADGNFANVTVGEE